MKRIEVKLSLGVVAPLLDVIKSAADSMDDELAAPQPLHGIDADLREVWHDDLVAAQNGDVQTLLALFNSDFFSSGVVSFDEDNADAILRACAAVRLRLRTRFIEDLPDETLESGEVDLDALPEPTRKAFMCFLFLDTVQKLIIEHLDAEILES